MTRNSNGTKAMLGSWALLERFLVALVAVLVACAPSAAPPPAATAPPAAPTAAKAAPAAPTTAAATPAKTAPAPTTAAAAPAAKTSSALAQIIEGAKKEGRVSAILPTDVATDRVNEMRDGIRKKYGLDLAIEAVPSDSYPATLAKGIAEQKAGVAPSADLVTLSDIATAQAVRAGILEKVDWAPLLAEGTPHEVMRYDGHSVVIFNGHAGMMYNPSVIPAAEAPKIWTDLGNPKWRGKIAM
ncbi:MAG: ABC transporter substrate-binding protein [Chloroflexi bacterium]|nr:ABC transporter substrate-binding protein [Chloroflexota bacterium]